MEIIKRNWREKSIQAKSSRRRQFSLVKMLIFQGNERLSSEYLFIGCQYSDVFLFILYHWPVIVKALFQEAQILAYIVTGKNIGLIF